MILLCSAASKMVASFTTYPHEVRSAAHKPPSCLHQCLIECFLQVVRTRLQVQRIQLQRAPPANSPTSLTRPPPLEPPITPATYRGLVPTIREILHEAGWKGFYRGLGVNLVRTVPNSAVTMLTCV